jgi:uncharacterized protein DUF4132
VSPLRRRLRGSEALTPEQEALLARHRKRAGDLVGALLLGRTDADDSPPDRLASVVVAASAALPEVEGLEAWNAAWQTSLLVHRLVRRKLPWTVEDAELLFALARRNAGEFEWELLEQLAIPIAAAERVARDGGLDRLRPTLEDALRALERLEVRGDSHAPTQARRRRLRKLIDSGREPSLDLALLSRDAWGKAIRAALEGRTSAGPLLAHLAAATSARPSGKWTTRAAEVVAGNEDVIRLLLEEAVRCDVPVTQRFVYEGREYREYHWLFDANATLVRGAAWTLPIFRPPWALEVLEPLVRRGIAHGTKVANACVYALGALATPAAVALLSRLAVEVKDRGFQKQVQAAIDAAATRLEVSPTQLLERVVPTYGLDADGRRQLTVGDWTAELAVESSRVTTRWLGPEDEEEKAAPAAARDDPALAEVKAAAKELRKALSTERSRLESLLADDAVWSYDDWRAAYRDHPFVGVIARHLFWRFDGEPALGDDAPANADEVRLWHPATSTAEEVRALRGTLLERELVQPFKQAYREVYLLAPAERETRMYSNRFAAHVLHYPQTYALLKERGWGGHALGAWDGGDATAVFKELRGPGLRVEWFLHSPDAGWTGAALASLATTDQVRFRPLRPRNAEPVALEEVPPLVFSEAMRDVDLFVGVSSVGADPTWADTGPDAHLAYWNAFSFGELDEPAEIRRELLAKLIPKLRIADRLELGDRFLRVRGDLRTYRIHLRSGNILMEPDDQYLCIVPAPAAERPTTKVFLPFEDDRRLNVILSKAFLLASDTKIGDPTITQQITARR